MTVELTTKLERLPLIHSTQYLDQTFIRLPIHYRWLNNSVTLAQL